MALVRASVRCPRGTDWNVEMAAGPRQISGDHALEGRGGRRVGPGRTARHIALGTSRPRPPASLNTTKTVTRSGRPAPDCRRHLSEDVGAATEQLAPQATFVPTQ